jgi:hypothetical protein
MAPEKLLPWARPLLLSSTLTQATIYVLRPMITYRAIELDASTYEIGVVAALYALFPGSSSAAIWPTGWKDR